MASIDQSNSGNGSGAAAAETAPAGAAFQAADGTGIGIIVRDKADRALHTQDMTLNVGPQHPATHGVLRVLVTLDGEMIEDAQPVIGYMHRSFEKLAEHRDYRQIIALVNRHDWVSAVCNELGVALVVEKQMDLEVPERATWIRMLMCEWTRVLNHLMFVGSYPLELGAITPMFYAFREREEIQALMEWITGGRLHLTYCRIGGLKQDLPRGAIQMSRDLVPKIRRRIKEYEDLVLGNEIFMARTKGVGVLPADVACSYGVSGALLQASGVPEDARRTEPYCFYDQVEFDVPVRMGSDCYDRYAILIERMKESLKIIEQIHDRIPPGPVNVRLPKIVRAPQGHAYVRTENPLGQLSYYMVSHHEKTPWRFKMRTPSFNNVSSLPYLLKGTLVPDMIAVMGSMFFIVGDI
ncbi:MAG TPA: NADH-quinone oxidoreductase subunit D, partial [Actinomycetes bacterium]|nr:NADH-quinone oxidoreductase subunit D [Actinomycetes bacterium]